MRYPLYQYRVSTKVYYDYNNTSYFNEETLKINLYEDHYSIVEWIDEGFFKMYIHKNDDYIFNPYFDHKLWHKGIVVSDGFTPFEYDEGSIYDLSSNLLI